MPKVLDINHETNLDDLTILKPPQYSEWECDLFGMGGQITVQPLQGRAPNFVKLPKKLPEDLKAIKICNKILREKNKPLKEGWDLQYKKGAMKFTVKPRKKRVKKSK